jgi:hypothetical protein
VTPQASAGYSKRPRLDKLGVKPDARVAVLGLSDAAFQRELKTRTRDVSIARPRAASDLVFLAVERASQLARLGGLRRRLQPAGAIWVLWPKGRPALREDDIRTAAKDAGLVDVKVVAFSEVLSGLKLVIPVALR